MFTCLLLLKSSQTPLLCLVYSLGGPALTCNKLTALFLFAGGFL